MNDMTTEGYTSLQLGLALRLHTCTAPTLGDVVGADSIPLPEKFPIFYVINSSSTPDQPGHWLCIFRRSKLSASEYFDSLQKKPSVHSQDIANYLAVTSPSSYLTNTFPVQPNESKHCGLFVCFFACRRSMGESFETVMSHFKPGNLEYNDQMVYDYYYDHILGSSIFSVGEVKA